MTVEERTELEWAVGELEKADANLRRMDVVASPILTVALALRLLIEPDRNVHEAIRRQYDALETR